MNRRRSIYLSAVRLAGLRNPDLFLARQRVVEAAALRQLAAAQLLPNLNGGGNFDSHSGPLQQSPGNILRVSRSSLYVGAGANAIAAGTVNIPGVVWNLNVTNSIFGILVSRQVVRERQFANRQTNNDILQQVGYAYYELLRNEGLRAVAVQIRDETAQVARLTAAFAAHRRGASCRRRSGRDRTGPAAGRYPGRRGKYLRRLGAALSVVESRSHVAVARD